MKAFVYDIEIDLGFLFPPRNNFGNDGTLTDGDGVGDDEDIESLLKGDFVSRQLCRLCESRGDEVKC